MFAPMRDHPFQVRDDSDMQQLMESIKEYGVIVPILARPNPVGEGAKYEIVSGHRRFEACKRLGIEDIPVIVRNLDDDEAILAMVDSNLHREQLLPSEKAFAYKMKFDALKRQGARSDLTSEQVAPKLSTEIIGEQENTSKDTIKRYIRLTKLIKPLLDLVDEGKIALTPAEKLSYLKEAEQLALVELIQDYDSTPSLSQAVKLKEMSAKQMLDADMMFDVMSRPKPNQKETLKLDLEAPRNFFPDCSPKDIESAILKILTEWKKKEQSKEQHRKSWDREGR
jgi:ParB family chromosome partitioning protein